MSEELDCFLSLLFHRHFCFCLSCLHPTFLLGYVPRYFLFYELTPGFIGAYAIISLTEFYHKTCHTSFHLALFGLDQRPSHFFFLQRLSKYIGLCEPHRFCHSCIALLFWHKSHLSRRGCVSVEQAWGPVCSIAHCLWITVPCHRLLSSF